MKLTRVDIPVLEPRSLRKGEPGIVQRSFSYGKHDTLRWFRDEPLDLSITLNSPAGVAARVVLHTDMNSGDLPGPWQEIPFSADGNHFHLRLQPQRCGLFRFRIKYSLDGGAQWFWDRVPHSYVMVDPPGIRAVRLYTLIPGASGTISDWKRLLPGIAAMGFDTLHLLPVSQMGYSESPYAARNLFDVDARYRDPQDPRSTLEQFEEFVDSCRRHGIRLCLDLVLNHVSSDSQIVHSRPDWIVPDDSEPDGFKRAGCWHMQSWIRWQDLVPLYFDHPDGNVRLEIWDYIKRYASFWSSYAYQTGGMVRFDNLHSSNNDFIADLSRSLRQAYPDLAILGEYFTDELTLERTVPEWGINLLLANSWEHPFGPALRHYIGYLHNVSPRLRHLCSITTHDTGVPAQLFGAARSAIPRYAICALMTTGQTGLVQGVESAVTERVAFIGPLRTQVFQPDPALQQAFARINRLLAESDTLRQGGNLTFVDSGHDAILAGFRKHVTPSGSDYLILANLDIDNPQTLTLALHQTGLPLPCPARDVWTGEPVEFTADSRITLDACGYRVFEFIRRGEA